MVSVKTALIGLYAIVLKPLTAKTTLNTNARAFVNLAAKQPATAPIKNLSSINSFYIVYDIRNFKYCLYERE